MLQMKGKDLKVKAKQYGFTLAELLLVVVIICLIGGAGGGIYMGTYKKLLVEKAARDLLLTAKYARLMAIERQHRYEIQLDVTNNRYSVTTTRWDEETRQTEEVIVKDYYCRPVEFAGDVKFEDVRITPLGPEATPQSEENREIIFTPNGTAQSAIIQIGNGNNHYTVAICAATGKATMHFGTAEQVESRTIDLDAE